MVTFTSLDDLRTAAGTHLGWTEWIDITQDRVNLFADATGDQQWIHVDVERATAESPFGGPIAHGYLTLALSNLFLPQLIAVPAASAGVMALTRCAAMEAADHGVRVNAVAPSIAMHPFLAKVTTDELLDELTQREAFGRAAEPWEIATVIAFLASDYSTYMTGEVVSVSSQRA